MKIPLMLSLVLLSFAGLADDVVPADKVKVAINVRQGPDTGSEVVARLKQGDSLPLVKTVDGWYEVRLTEDTTGFVSADWARVIAATADDETTDETTDEMADTMPTVSEEIAEAGAEAAVEEPMENAAGVAEAEMIEAEAAEEIVERSDPFTGAADVEQQEAIEVGSVELTPSAVAPQAVAGPAGPAGPPGPPGAANIKGSQNFLVKFKNEAEGGNSQIYDDGNQIGIGTTEPKQRLEVNGSIQIHEQNSSVAGLMITQSSGDTGYIIHNQASTLTIGAGSQDRITIDRDGNVGIAVARPEHPLEMASGAHATSGGVWTNSSSRERKENISLISLQQATAALADLEPVSFNYRNEQDEDYVGFIAEDVPDLVASRDRQTLSAMDIVAVLTRVVQAQQQRIEDLEARLD